MNGIWVAVEGLFRFSVVKGIKGNKQGRDKEDGTLQRSCNCTGEIPNNMSKTPLGLHGAVS